MNLALTESEFPVRLRFESPLSDEDLLRFCAENDALRVEREPNGEILVMTPANSKTSMMNFRICGLLYAWAEADGRGVGFDSSGGYTLPDTSMRNPDAAWMLKSRWHAISGDDQSRFAPACPDFILELRSPSDRLRELQAKMQQWIANGAQVAWLVDPIEKAVTVYRPGQSAEHLLDPTSVQGTGPIAGFELILSRVWS